jgi:hypothetical protein
MSEASRVFSGETMTIRASHVSIACTSSGAGIASRSTGAARTQARGVKLASSNVSRSSAYASRSATTRTISSSSGRPSGEPPTSTCQPGCTPMHVSTRSSASCRSLGSLIARI